MVLRWPWAPGLCWRISGASAAAESRPPPLSVRRPALRKALPTQGYELQRDNTCRHLGAYLAMIRSQVESWSARPGHLAGQGGAPV